MFTESVCTRASITKGYRGKGKGEKIGKITQFLCIARGSNLEVETQILIAKELHFVDTSKIERVENLTVEIDKMLNTIVKKL